ETITIQRITDPTIATSVVQPNCNGDNGTVNVVISDGTAPFSATINSTTGPFTSTQAGLNTNTVSFTGLASDTYEVIITDANGCVTAASTETVAAPNALTGGSAAATALTCNPAGGTVLGGISYTAPTGGTTAYTYFYKLLADATYTQVVGTSVSNLAAGTYNTRVVDANGCILNLNDVTIAPLPTAPTLTSVVAYNCDGTGNITITTAPAGAYTYSLDGAAAQAGATFNNVAVGPHTITVAYGSSCTTDISVNVEPNNAFDATITASTGNNCNASNDGTITIEAINIVGNFDYSTDGGTNWNTTTSNPFTITGLSAGSQTVEVRPDNSSPAACTKTIGTVILANPTVISVTAAITKEASCAAPTGATITATPAGGTAPYRYNINGGAWQTSPVFTGIAASGTAYTINIEDANNCASSTPVTVNSPSTVAFNVVPEVCYDGSNGELVITVTSGGGNYQFSLDGGPLQASGTNTYTFTGLTNGTYSVTVQDGLGCSTTTNNHTINDQLSATATVTDASCNTGQILVNPTGGAGSYVFSLVAANAAQPADGTYNNTNPILTGNGTYDVYVRDNNGTGTYCQFIIEDVVVNQIPNVALTVTGNQPTCNGDTGSIDLQINAGTGQSPHTIVVTNGLGPVTTVNNFLGSNTSFNNLVAETYTITITDALGCSDTETVTLTDPPALTATIVPERPVCGTPFVGNETLFGYDFTGVPAVLAGQKIQYSVDNGATWQDSPTFRGTAGNPDFNYGTVTFPAIRITDIATSSITYCLNNLGSYTMPFEVSPLVVNITTNSLDCTVGAEAIVNVTGGVGPYQYTYNTIQVAPGPGGWVPAGGTASSTFTFTGLIPGRTYFFFVRDLGDNNCVKVDDTFTINIDVDITPSILSQSCNGGATGSLQFDIDDTSANLLNGGAPPFNWELFNLDIVTGVSTSVETGTQGSLAAILPAANGTLAPGTYYLQIENAAGTCTFASPNVEILENAPINANLTVVNDITCSTNGIIRVDNVTGGTAPYTYSVGSSTNFTPGDATVTGNTIEFAYADVTNPALDVTGINITITDSNGNSCTASVGPETLTVSPSPTVATVPNSCGANNTITITAGSGTPPYQYSTDGGTTYSAPTTSTTYLAEGLTPASYNVIVRDANGCTSPVEATTIQAPLDFTLVQTKNIDCSVTPAAAVAINVTTGSGLANYEYEITGPSAAVVRTALGANPLTFNPTTAGTYTVTIFDIAETPNCSTTKTITIAARVEPVFSAVATVNDICDAANTGEITVTTTDNGILPLNYTITPDPAAAGTISSAAGVVFSSLPAGNYTIRGTSTVNSCFTEQVVEIRDLNPIVPSVPTITEFACTTGNVVNSANITLPAGTVGGTGTYTRVVFTYTPVTGAVETQDSASLSFTTTNTSGGPVTIVVFDDKGCSSAVVNSAIGAFNAISAPVVTIDNAITCNSGEDITVTYTATVAVAANITIEGTNGTVYAAVTNTTGDFDNLPTGEYKITITHPTTGCLLETFHTVGVAPQFDILISDVTNETCRTNDDGSALLDFSPATPYAGNYDYVVYIAATNAIFRTVNGQTGNSPIANLPAGEYYVITTLTSTGAPFCTARSANFTIEEPANPLLVSGVVNPPVSCNGGSNGTITASATGGWGSYQYQLEDLANNVIGGYTYSNNNVFTGLAPGDYRIRVTDGNGCPRSNTVNIPTPAPVTFTVVENDNVCDSSTGGSITVTAAGGTGTYVYSLTVGGTVVASQTLTATT
ncbi:SprB repeat-containing protein, partial [uncultured Tenacibaculum sp.]|uniref:SprB repeat-containing protein n=1 Tax=uncultured Tenacibaculum sp. TaxID=174713 RepID=UPI00262508AA